MSVSDNSYKKKTNPVIIAAIISAVGVVVAAIAPLLVASLAGPQQKLPVTSSQGMTEKDRLSTTDIRSPNAVGSNGLSERGEKEDDRTSHEFGGYGAEPHEDSAIKPHRSLATVEMGVPSDEGFGEMDVAVPTQAISASKKLPIEK